ncbi:MAG: hypothetical protein WCB31_08785 [Nitrososphaeraceae archaeon]
MSDVKSLQQDFVVLVKLQPPKGSIDSKSTNVRKQNNMKELSQNQEIKKVSVNVVLGTHIYTLFDHEVSIKLYNLNAQFASQYLTVSATGNVSQPFMIDETCIPEGTLFTICITNEGNFKEVCKNVSRAYGVDYIPVYTTVP